MIVITPGLRCNHVVKAKGAAAIVVKANIEVFGSDGGGSFGGSSNQVAVITKDALQTGCCEVKV